mgnify:CR=1 FL=1
MTDTEKKNYATALLRVKSEELGRLPKEMTLSRLLFHA